MNFAVAFQFLPLLTMLMGILRYLSIRGISWFHQKNLFKHKEKVLNTVGPEKC